MRAEIWRAWITITKLIVDATIQTITKVSQFATQDVEIQIKYAQIDLVVEKTAAVIRKNAPASLRIMAKIQ